MTCIPLYYTYCLVWILFPNKILITANLDTERICMQYLLLNLCHK